MNKGQGFVKVEESILDEGDVVVFGGGQNYKLGVLLNSVPSDCKYVFEKKGSSITSPQELSSILEHKHKTLLDKSKKLEEVAKKHELQNKKLQQELDEMRRQHENSSKEIQSLKHQIQKAEAEYNARKLVELHKQNLEKDRVLYKEKLKAENELKYLKARLQELQEKEASWSNSYSVFEQVTPTPTSSFYAVVDTNCLLRSTHLEELLKFVVLVIPFVVIQELDGLKLSKDQDIALLARKAINFLYSNLQKKNPNMRGQTLEEIEKSASFACRNNDDKILNCCIYYKNRVAKQKDNVVLLSYDKNLCVKASVNNITALQPEIFLKNKKDRIKM